MDDDRRRTVRARRSLPDKILVYQGRTETNDDGWSWTTKRDTAVWFANRFARFDKDRPWLTIGTVDKANVKAYLLARNEFEILVDPGYVEILQIGPLLDSLAWCHTENFPGHVSHTPKSRV